MRTVVAGAWVLGVFGLTWVNVARAQEPTPDALQGPRVVEHARPASLVQREMGGALVRLEVRPEEAALELLDLTKEQKEAAAKAVQERFVQVSKALSEDYDLFLKIQAARQGGAEREELVPLVREFAEAARPLLDPPLVERIGAVVPEERRARYRELVDEYKKAVIQDEAAKRESKEVVSERRAAMRAEINLTLREMGRALRATVTDRRERTDELIKKLDVTPDQEAKIRAIIRETAGKEGVVGELNEERRREMMQKVLAELTPEQRRAAIERLRQR